MHVTITEDLARDLSVKPSDMVSLYGVKLIIYGVISQESLRKVLDLDGQPIAPFDPDIIDK